jgi:hypothetical protein
MVEELRPGERPLFDERVRFLGGRDDRLQLRLVDAAPDGRGLAPQPLRFLPIANRAR